MTERAGEARGAARRAPDVALTIAAGGALGALARYGVLLAWPYAGAGFPWATLVVNVTGSLAIGALMVLLDLAGRPHRLARPFVGVGFLGGYTTFSTYAVDAHGLVLAGEPGTAALYVVGTVIAALLAVEAGAGATRWVTSTRQGATR